jgi:hypothetical protein
MKLLVKMVEGKKLPNKKKFNHKPQHLKIEKKKKHILVTT